MRPVTTLLSLMSMSVRARRQYKVTFTLSVMSTLLMFAAEFSLVYFLGQKVGAIHGWTPAQLTVLYVGTLLASALEVVFVSNLRNFDRELVDGGLDLKLLKPMHPLLQLIGQISVDAIAMPLFCIAALAFTLHETLELWTWVNVAIFLTGILGGALIFSSFTVLSAAFAFWTFDSNSIYEITRKGTRQLLWYPLDIYGVAVRTVLFTVLPVAFVAYVPVQFIVGRSTELPWWMALSGPCIGLVSLSISLLVWHAGLRRYQGTGS
ncbi:ABC transporter permease [Deinococcus sp. QL22]|uniref:ABC transporter permease n=1 Tax=Deinococcus sp. QL22 TaxID=2939437 RepID=UPI00201830C5|nr:ABC-2 family transporter protein [Deinococcus sp. QL22]UQN07956.1 ABC transporter permease [Deinococcus sp. QL22]